MKQLFITILCAIISFSINAQITVTDADIVNVGDIIYEALDSVSGSSIQIGSAGANHTWDFSFLQENELDVIQHIDPNSTPFSSIHPTSNICIDGDDYIYINKSSSSVDIVGVDDISLLNPVTILPLPLTYGLQFSTGSIIALDEAEENVFLPDSLASLITFGAAHKVDSFGVKTVIEHTFYVDGYGDVIIPIGTFPALRLNASAINTTTYSLYCTDTLFGLASGWYPMPQQIFPSESDTSYFYQWWSNDPLIKFALINIDVDEFGNNEGYVQFVTNNPSSVSEKINNLDVNVLPIPATNLLTIQTLENKIVFLSLVDMLGRVILEDSFSKETVLDMQIYPSGNYYLTLESGDQKITKRIILN